MTTKESPLQILRGLDQVQVHPPSGQPVSPAGQFFADTTVARNIQTLDNELIEFEVRVSCTPGLIMEPSSDVTPSSIDHPFFDVFSGPKVYDPNVDPETSVN